MDSLQFENVLEKLKNIFMKYSAFFNTLNSSSITFQRPQVPRAKLAWQKVNNIINFLPF
jgi:hypothetical protein